MILGAALFSAGFSEGWEWGSFSLLAVINKNISTNCYYQSYIMAPYLSHRQLQALKSKYRENASKV
jgi:hypothetical protein